MKLIASFILVSMLYSTTWRYNYDEALQLAKKEHKHILLNFSGSDWCGPCTRLHNEVFTKDAFNQLADKSLVLLTQIFPAIKRTNYRQHSKKLMIL